MRAQRCVRGRSHTHTHTPVHAGVDWDGADYAPSPNSSSSSSSPSPPSSHYTVCCIYACSSVAVATCHRVMHGARPK